MYNKPLWDSGFWESFEVRKNGKVSPFSWASTSYGRISYRKSVEVGRGPCHYCRADRRDCLTTDLGSQCLPFYLQYTSDSTFDLGEQVVALHTLPTVQEEDKEEGLCSSHLCHALCTIREKQTFSSPQMIEQPWSAGYCGTRQSVKSQPNEVAAVLQQERGRAQCLWTGTGGGDTGSPVVPSFVPYAL